MRYLFLFVLLTVITSCARKNGLPPRQEETLSDSLLHSLTVDTARAQPVDGELMLSGKIAANEDKLARIFPMVSGIVTDVKVHSGDYVQKGQVLAVLRSAEMAGYTADQRVSESDMQVARRNMEVAESFYKGGLSSQKDYEEARSNYDKAVATWKRSKAVLDINGGPHETSYLVKAPVPGFVIGKQASENTHWRSDNADPIFVVADLQDVWAVINVYESDISSIRTGDEVEMTTLAYPGRVFTGKIAKINNVLDPENKVMKARVIIDNPGYLLKPEMFVRIRAVRHADSSQVTIPARGIIFDHDKYYVLVRTPQQPGVSIREVQVDKTVEDRAYISSGLRDGERVIASRQVFIYESLRGR